MQDLSSDDRASVITSVAYPAGHIKESFRNANQARRGIVKLSLDTSDARIEESYPASAPNKKFKKSAKSDPERDQEEIRNIIISGS